jgi:cytochrome c oxidase cbb3-type subunit 3
MATIRDGRAGTGMPPFSHLGRKDVEAIVAYLRVHAKLPNRSAEIDAQPRSQGDERLGRFWFESICSTCHGPNGDGYAAGGTGTAIGKAAFLDKATDGFIRETIKKGRSNTRMIGYSGPEAMANLSDGDVNDIIAYLRTVPSK